MQKLESNSDHLEFQLPLVVKVFVFVIPLWIINAYATRLGLWPVGIALSVITASAIIWQWPKIERGIVKLRHKAINDYHVSPKTFAVLYIFSFAPFYLGLFMMAEGVVRQSWALVALGGLINRFSYALPYLYVIFWGDLTEKVGIWKIRLRLNVLVWGWIVISVAFFVLTKVLS
ncbi:hypothetical protein HYX70_04765 [Candidatus Saccharibacteria bacterium]|nr:hypothetical protein [Candidatus Saccharibacteria bacterium]